MTEANRPRDEEATAERARLVIDHAGRILEVNEPACRFLMTTRAALRELHFAAFIARDELLAYYHFMERPEGEAVSHALLNLSLSDGIVLPTALTMTVENLDSPQTTRYTIFLDEVEAVPAAFDTFAAEPHPAETAGDARTAKRAAPGADDETFIPSDEIFRHCFEASAISMAVTDMESRILYCNDSMTEFLQWPSDKLSKMTVLDMTYPADREAAKYVLDKLRSWDADYFQAVDFRFIRESGETVYADAHIGKIKDDKGRPKYFVFQLKDMSERKALETELQTYRRQLEARVQERTAELEKSNKALATEIMERKKAENVARKLAAAVEQCAEPMLITDLRGRVEYVNPAFTSMTGFSRVDMIGQIAALFRQESHTPETFVGFASRVEQGKEWKGKYIERDKYGKPTRVRAVMSPVNDRDGILSRWVAVLEDITELEAREQERKELDDQITEQARMISLGEMSACVAHELNQPLFCVNGAIALLQEDLKRDRFDAGRAVELLSDARSQIARLAHIAEQMRSFAASCKNDDAEADLIATLDNAFSLFDNRLRDEGVKIKRETPEKMPSAKISPVELEQIFIHLIRNAIDALSETPRGNRVIGVTIAMPDDRRKLEIRFHDNGPGISPQVINRIFDPFFSAKPLGAGSGMGLSVAYGLSKRYGGDIHCHSVLGAGSTFLLTLPVAEAIGETPKPCPREGDKA